MFSKLCITSESRTFNCYSTRCYRHTNKCTKDQPWWNSSHTAPTKCSGKSLQKSDICTYPQTLLPYPIKLIHAICKYHNTQNSHPPAHWIRTTIWPSRPRQIYPHEKGHKWGNRLWRPCPPDRGRSGKRSHPKYPHRPTICVNRFHNYGTMRFVSWGLLRLEKKGSRHKDKGELQNSPQQGFQESPRVSKHR